VSELKLGALAPKRPFGLATLATYAKGKLPAPPAKVPVPSVSPWQMFLNDTYGDCTVAGVAHAILAWNAEVGEHDHIPTDAEVQAEYFELTGGADSGCVEADVLQQWHNHGMFGARIAGYAPVEPHDIIGFHQAVAFFGAAYLGVALPESAQEQFAANQAWTVVPGSPIEGGHCIVAVGYDQHYVQCVTWGKVVNVSYPWLAKYCTEVWAILPHQFAEAGKDGAGIDLKSLQADLAAL
jgi:hypothetical protein